MSKYTSKLSINLSRKFKSFYNHVNVDDVPSNVKQQAKYLAELEKRTFLLVQSMIDEFEEGRLK